MRRYMPDMPGRIVRQPEPSKNRSIFWLYWSWRVLLVVLLGIAVACAFLILTQPAHAEDAPSPSVPTVRIVGGFPVRADYQNIIFESMAKGLVLWGAPAYPIREIVIGYSTQPYIVYDQVSGTHYIFINEQFYWEYVDLAFEMCRATGDPLVDDVYSMGLCGVFARELLDDLAYGWQVEEYWWDGSVDPLHALSYQMSSQIERGAPGALWSAWRYVQFVAPNQKIINSDRWLGALDKRVCKRAWRAIDAYADRLSVTLYQLDARTQMMRPDIRYQSVCGQ